MNKIGFKNFRRFQNFEPIAYQGITFLVGRNNTGKSTLVKALLLIDNYFKSDVIDTLSFGNNILEDANIVNYGRAKNIQANENFIHFTQEIENYFIELTVTGEDDKTFANVHSLNITDLSKKLSFNFNLQNRYIRIVKSTSNQAGKAAQSYISVLKSEISLLTKQLEEDALKKTSKEYIEVISKLEVLNEKLFFVNQELKDPNQDTMLFSLDEDFGNVNSLSEVVDELISHSESQYHREIKNIQNGEIPSERFEDLRTFIELNPSFVKSSFSQFMILIKDTTIAYVGANPAKQSALFAIRDKNNALAQAIHEYKQLNIIDGEDEHRFVLKWMQEFEVGEDFTVSMHAGEAYEMKIHSNKSEIHLADKGMGSIQAMLLIMRIACIIKRTNIAKKHSRSTPILSNKDAIGDSSLFKLKTIVIIEEPELNLHPALQSKLADLFLYVNQPPFNLNFIIETHSEYILRRSQVLVAENEFEIAPNENPFCVHYFPKDTNLKPYKLEYKEDGSFKRNFGDGFFDEASSSTLELLKLKRLKKN